MSDDASDDSNDTYSLDYAFDLPQFNLHGLRIYVGPRREDSVEHDTIFDRHEWETNDEDVRDNTLNPDDLGFDRGFLGPNDLVSRLMGQAIDLALHMMETQKSIDIMTRVAMRMVNDSPQAVLHMTPQSTPAEVQRLARNWLSILRRHEFFKIQLIEDGSSNSSVSYRDWARFLRDTPATLADYYPHNAGMLRIDVKILEKLAYHALPNNIHSETERQKCLFHVANLIINQAQAFWVAFLRPGMADRGAIELVAVHSPATVGLLDFYDNPSSGYHWDAEFFGGLVIMRYNRDNPSTRRNQYGGFGRTLSVGDPYLDRADGTEQRIAMHSITRCLNRDFADVLQSGLRVEGVRVPAFGFPFLDYSARRRQEPL